MRVIKLTALLGLVLLAACRGDGVSPQGPSWFRASLSGEVSGQYEGTGDFAFLHDPDDGRTRYFKIRSEGGDAGVSESFYFRWPNGRRPHVGTHPLVPFAHASGSSTGVTAVYNRSEGDNVSSPHAAEQYVSLAGEVEITRSTADEVEGTVRFSGIQTVKSGAWGTSRYDAPYAPDAAAPRIEVTGSFRVTRWDENGFVVGR